MGKSNILIITMFTACAPPEEVLKTLFRIAVDKNDVKQLEKLLKQCKSDLKNVDSGRLLWQAIRKGHVEIAEMLIRANVDLNQRRDKNNESYLHYLVKHNSPENCKLALLMVDYGADVKACDNKNESVVDRALGSKALDFIDGLIERGILKDNKPTSDQPSSNSSPNHVQEQSQQLPGPQSLGLAPADDELIANPQFILCYQHINAQLQKMFNK